MAAVAESVGCVQNLLAGGLSKFAASIDPEWIEQALSATGTASARKRKFPAEQVVWLVLGMALLADRSISAVLTHLDLTLGKSLVPSAVAQARGRLGFKPLAWLFEKVAQSWACEADAGLFYRGLRVWGVDGTHLRLQDTDEVSAHFGRPGGRDGVGDSGYPQARIVTLMDLRSRQLVDACVGPWTSGEQTLARTLWNRIADDSLVIFDRGFISYLTFLELAAEGHQRHWLTRARSNTRVEITAVLPDGSQLGLLYPPQAFPQSADAMPGPLEVRVITYRHAGSAESRLITTLLDHVRYPAQELVQLYHERWELELSYDELKVHLLERNECLRSKTVDGVMQEIWGVLLLYNLVRREMTLVARDRGLEPTRVSFRGSVLWIRNFWLLAWHSSPGTMPKQLSNLRASMETLILPPRRTDRRYPRHVKIKMSNYPRNRGKQARRDAK
jgi:hypothetical protein